MANKQRAAEDLLADLNDLPDDPNAAPGGTAPGDVADVDEASINDFLAEFSKERERPSRPITPRLQGNKARASPRLSVHADRARRSTEVPRTSTDSRRSTKDETQTFTNSSAANSDKDEKNDEQESDAARSDTPTMSESQTQKKVYGSANSWSAWGGSLWSTANTLQAQLRAEAEKRLADLQASEEAQALQARLREIDLSKLASEARNIGKGVLDAVAPPIEDNETLVVNVLHDITGLRVERNVYNPFERVMDQVEGGSLVVVAKDREGTLDVSASAESKSIAKKMSLAAIEDAKRDAETEKVEKTSNIYLSIQAYKFANNSAEQGDSDDAAEDAEVSFLLSLVDPSNGISFSTTSQPFPAAWVPLSLYTVDAAIQPREWISEWLEETLALTAGILAQRYVARRMGIAKAQGDGEAATAGEHGGESGGMKVREGQDLSEAGLGL